MHERRVIRARRGSARVTAFCVVVVGTFVAGAGVAYALKVTPSPNPLMLQEGSSQLVSLLLDEPIIAPGGGPEPTVVVTLTVDDPSRVSLSAPSMTWTASEWSQSRTVTVTAVHDGVHDGSNTVLVHAVAASASPYYDGFATSFTVSIADVDPAATTTTTIPAAPTSTISTSTTTTARPSSTTIAVPTTISPNRAAAELPKTGTDTQVPIAVGVFAIAFGAALTLGRVATRGRRRSSRE